MLVSPIKSCSILTIYKEKTLVLAQTDVTCLALPRFEGRE